MLFAKPHSLLEAAATADLLDPDMSTEVKDTVEELEDTLTTNVEEVPADETLSNGQPVTITPESCIVTEATGTYRNGAKYLIEMSDVIRLMEAETTEPEPEDPEEAPADEPDAGDLVEKVADACGVEKDDIAIVISTDECALMCEHAILEAKAGRSGKKAQKKLSKFKRALRAMKNHGIKLVKTKKKK